MLEWRIWEMRFTWLLGKMTQQAGRWDFSVGFGVGFRLYRPLCLLAPVARSAWTMVGAALDH